MTPELEQLLDELHDQIAPEHRRLTMEAVCEAARAASGGVAPGAQSKAQGRATTQANGTAPYNVDEESDSSGESSLSYGTFAEG